ncbi:MAG: nitroreductase [Clostridia bacterium]|nr:nitroreductase [Clostridia bacterium]
MNEVLEKIKTRRSVRRFKSDMPDKATVDRIIEAGIYAASGRNRQSAIIVAVTDKQTREKLVKINAEIMGADTDPFYNAPVILIVLSDKNVPTHVYDGSLVMGNLMLAAHAEGLGSCWIHRAKETFEAKEWKEWLASLGVEGEYEGIGHCALGYIEGDYNADLPRKQGRVFYV